MLREGKLMFLRWSVWEVWLNHLYIPKYKWHIISERWACLQDKIHIHDWFYFEKYGDEEHGNLWFKFLYSWFTLTYFLNSLNNAKINDSQLNILWSSLVKMFFLVFVRGGMSLHDVVGVNCKKNTTTENQGAGA